MSWVCDVGVAITNLDGVWFSPLRMLVHVSAQLIRLCMPWMVAYMRCVFVALWLTGRNEAWGSVYLTLHECVPNYDVWYESHTSLNCMHRAVRLVPPCLPMSLWVCVIAQHELVVSHVLCAYETAS